MEIIMTLNEHVNVDTERYSFGDRFYPDDGYALWDDTYTDNLDENGNPYTYSLQIIVPKANSVETAPHIWAKLIDDTMEVFGKIPGQSEVMTLALDEEVSSHTYIDENGVEQMKKGVY